MAFAARAQVGTIARPSEVVVLGGGARIRNSVESKTAASGSGVKAMRLSNLGNSRIGGTSNIDGPVITSRVPPDAQIVARVIQGGIPDWEVKRRKEMAKAAKKSARKESARRKALQRAMKRLGKKKYARNNRRPRVKRRRDKKRRR
jgi:bifunctional N-acetylglucosamine-1-phosphate-uridyltransferase/glucosamine-1-phosphate-acetyltransferase GlmU-like protein